MSNRKANIVLAILSIMLVATWVWFFISKKDAVASEGSVPVETTTVFK